MAQFPSGEEENLITRAHTQKFMGRDYLIYEGEGVWEIRKKNVSHSVHYLGNKILCFGFETWRKNNSGIIFILLLVNCTDPDLPLAITGGYITVANHNKIL